MKYLFLHVPKTAGTSLRKALENQFQESDIARCYFRGEIENKLKKALEEEKRLIYGHINFKHLHNVGGYERYQLMAFFRLPVQRVISTYIHLINSRIPEQKKEVEAMGGFEGFLQSNYGNNWQCRFMSGIDRKYHSDMPAEELFELAKKNFGELHWVGITERYLESLVSMQKFMGVKRIPNVRTNLSRNSELKAELEDKFARELAERNEMDVRLWKLANQRLDDQLAQVPNLPLKRLRYKILGVFGL